MSDKMIQHSISTPAQQNQRSAEDIDLIQRPAIEAGWWLKREREQVGARVDDVVAATRIEPEYIRALESGQLELLPERDKALDLIWAYADFLMLEPGPLCSHYGKMLPETAPNKTLDIQQTEFKGIGILSRFLTPRIATGAMIGKSCALMVAMGAVIWMVAPSGNGQNDEVIAQLPEITAPDIDDVVTGTIPDKVAKKSPELPVARKVSDINVGENAYEQSDLTELIKRTVNETTKKQKIAKKVPAKVAAPAKTAVAKATGPIGQVYGAANKNSRIFIQAESRVFVRIEDNSGTVIFNQTLNAGDGFKVPDRKGLVLVARDGGALKYVVDGERSGALGTSGEILVGRSLDLDKLEGNG
jgi:cytoskeleton protein RodZ